MVKFIFNLTPVSQDRTRYSTRPFPHEYDTKKVAAYKKALSAMAVKQMEEKGLKPFDCAIEVRTVFYRPIQKSVSKIEKMRRHLGVVLPTVKPDSDNYVKSTWDAFNGVLWSDDSIITDMSAKKRYSFYPRIEVEIMKPKTKRPIKCVKNVWYFVNDDGSLDPVWSDEDESQNKRTDN